MKTATLVVLLLLPALPGAAQSLPELPAFPDPFETRPAPKPAGGPYFREIAQSRWYYDGNTGQRSVVDSIHFTYSNGRGSQQIDWPLNFDEAVKYAGPVGTPVDLYSRTRYQYNSRNQVTEYSMEMHSPGGWQPLQDQKFTYSKGGLLLQLLKKSSPREGDPLRDDERYEYGYDALGRLISTEGFLRDPVTAVLERSFKQTMTYTPGGKPDTLYYYYQNGQNWAIGSRTVYSYNSQGLPVYLSSDQLNGSVWTRMSTRYQHYTAAGLVDTIAVSWPSAPFSLKSYTYSATNKPLFYLVQEYNGLQGWYNKTQELWSYDAQDDSVLHLSQLWDNTQQAWGTVANQGYAYSNHRLTSSILSDPGSGQPTGKSDYTYNGDGLLTLETVSVPDGGGWMPAFDNRYYYENYVPTAVGAVPAESPATLLAWPNPAGSSIHVLGRTAPGQAVLQLVDAAGRTLRSLACPGDGSVNQQMDISTIPAGTYQLVLRSAAGRTATGVTVVK